MVPIKKAFAQAGFTLFELLIVILIISIITTCAILATGDFGQSKRIEASAEQFSQLLQLAEEQAILQTVTLGVVVSKNNYLFYEYEPGLKTNNPWYLLTKDPLLKIYSWPKNVLLIFDSDKKLNPAKPQIVIFPSGEISPFSLRLTESNQTFIQIAGQQNGAISVTEQNS